MAIAVASPPPMHSVATPRFPNGEIVYAYGSLFVDYLSRTRGDSTVGKFIEAQSAQLNPFALGHSSRAAFGISFDDAFASWRDSLQYWSRRGRRRTAGTARSGTWPDRAEP